MIQHRQIHGVMAKSRDSVIKISVEERARDRENASSRTRFWSAVSELRKTLISDPSYPSLLPTEWTMSAKKRRKVFGVRRETRRPRGWTRWFHEGLFEAEAAGGVRLRTVLWGPK